MELTRTITIKGRGGIFHALMDTKMDEQTKNASALVYFSCIFIPKRLGDVREFGVTQTPQILFQKIH